MPFHTLNGWEVDVKPSTFGFTPDFVGQMRKTYTGRPTRQQRAAPQTFKGETPVLDPDCADTLERLLDIENGHRWGFEKDLFSSAGLGPEDGFTGIELKHDGDLLQTPHYLEIVGAGPILWDADLDDDKWTVMYWFSQGAPSFAPLSHRVVRSDGAKWENGVRNDALSTPEILVASGVLSLTTTGDAFSDLVVFSFVVCAEALVGFYDYLAAKEVAHYWPLDNGRAIDIVGGEDGTLTAGPTKQAGQIGESLLFNGSTQYVALPDAVGTGLNGNTAISIGAWVQLDILGADTAFDSAGPTGRNKFIIDVTASGSARMGVSSDSVEATHFLESAAGVISFATWHLIVGVADLTAGTQTLYVDGKQVATGSFAFASGTWAGGVLAGGTRLGVNGSTPVNYLDGGIDDVRVHYRALTAAEITEQYACGLALKRIASPKTFSNLPRLDVSGSCINEPCLAETVSVLGKIGGQVYLQGEISNYRESTFALTEENHKKGTYPAGVLYAIRPDDDETLLSATGRGVIGSPWGSNASEAGVQNYVAFPFDDFKVRNYPADVTKYTDLGVEASEVLTGAYAVSVVVFARRASIGSTHALFALEVDAANAHRILLRLTASNEVEMGGRSAAADAFGSDTSTFTQSGDLDVWRTYAGSVNFRTAIASTFLVEPVGVLGDMASSSDTTTGLTFANTEAQGVGGISNFIGLQAGGTNPFNGEIAYVAVMRNHVLTESEVNAFDTLFRKGVWR